MDSTTLSLNSARPEAKGTPRYFNYFMYSLFLLLIFPPSL
jgi:hypothetical protein